MMIVNPSPNHIPGLRKLWKQAFGDPESFIDLFFEKGFSPHRCRCAVLGDEIAAALFWFETGCEGQKLAYLYGVCTAPDHRGKGLCRDLMADTHRHLKVLGFQGALLVPQDESLRAMYERMGYRSCTAVSEFTAPGEDQGLTLRKVTPAEYASLRRKLLPKGGVLQEGENLDFLSAFAHFFAGHDFLAAVSMEGEKLYCHELLGDADAAYGLVHALGFREGHFRIPGDDKAFAQFLSLTGDCVVPSYFGFAFD